MTGIDIRWFYSVIFNQSRSTSDAALSVHVPTSLGGFGRLKKDHKIED